jgi:hypothetical protein
MLSAVTCYVEKHHLRWQELCRMLHGAAMCLMEGGVILRDESFSDIDSSIDRYLQIENGEHEQ